MGEVKQLLNSLLWNIYGKQQQDANQSSRCRQHRTAAMTTNATTAVNFGQSRKELQRLSVRKLIDICAILKVEIRLMGYFLERVLISRDRNRRHQEVLCGFVDAILHLEAYNAHPKMRFSLSPPPPKAASAVTSPTNMQARTSGGPKSDDGSAVIKDDDAASDYYQWLHAMKLVARLPGGMPPEFRRKLWLSLADKYLKSKNVDWAKEEEKCFCEKWREDDEELGIQIVKDLHRTGSNLCTGPAGSINQAKLKRILLGYARYSPEVGYCQGFNMLGALILQVMEKEEAESMKVMIYLVEGVLPPGYFCGSMGGLQADMGVFRELMQTKLPRLAKHLQKLQGPGENAYEPPLTNVFTMQWFLTMFCTCLPMSCVLRVWDLVLIEGSDVLLRTALVLWSLLEERVLSARTADDFYCKMGSFSSELLNGHLIDSNGLIEKVVQLGAIPDIQKLRDKHLYNITPLRHNQGLQLYFDDEEPGSDEESQLAVATVWGIPWVRRGSHGQSSNAKQVPENKDRLALDISLLKKQYDRLRERQKQAHIILTTACSTARQGASPQNPIAMPVNQLLLGRSAIVTNKGRRVGPPPGAVPPARKPSLPTVLQTKPPERQLRRGETLHWRDTDLSKRRRDSLTWKEIRADRASLLREGADKAAIKSQKVRSRVGKSDSSSYSEESEDDDDASSTDTSLCDEDDPNSTGDKTHSSSIENSPKRKSKVSRKQKEAVARLQQLTEPGRDADKERQRPKSWAPSSTEIPFTLMTSESPAHSGDEQKTTRLHNYEDLLKEEEDSATESDRVGYKCAADLDWSTTKYSSIAGDLATTQLGPLHVQTDVLELPVITSTSQLSPMADISSYLNNATISPLPTPKPFFLDSTNSLGSGDGDDQRKFNVSDDGVTNEYFERVNSVERPTKLDLFYSLNEEDSIRDAYKDKDDETREVLKTEEDVNKVAVIVSPDFKTVKEKHENKVNVEKLRESSEEDIASVDRRMELLIDYSEKSSAAFIAEATNELSTSLGKEKIKDEENDRLASHIRDDDIPGEAKEHFEENFREAKENANTEHRGKRGPLDKQIALSNASKKRRDPRRLTLTRSSTIDIEERFQALERRLSSEEFAEDNLKSQTKAEDVTSKENTHKKIPSTTDLEERFNSLERQFSTGRGENKEIIESSIKKDNSTIAGVMDSAGESPTKPSRYRIPSTADLENRFNAMERQLSSNSLPGRGSINLQNSDDKKCNEDAQTPPNTPAEKSERDLETVDSKADVDADSTGDKAVHAADSGDRPRMRKLPSTAELEDRFNALERKMSIPKTSPSKTKKEPPDGQEKDDSTKVTAGDTVDEPNQTIRISEDNLDKTETSENAAKPKGTSSSEAETPTSSRLPEESEISKTRNKTKEIEVKCTKVKEQGGEIEGVKKKSPPSTEELEKRFQALEKQMSTASFEGEMEPKRKSSQAQREAEILHEEPTTSNATNIKENDSKSHNGEQTKKSLSSFEAKCKAVNEKLADKTAVNAETEKTEHTQQVSSADATAGESTEPEPNTKSIKYFENKCKAINKELTKNEEQLQGSEVVKHVEENMKEVEREKTQRDLTKRRASEPPSTEDLEKRFESLKRRMSTKAIIEKGFGRPEHSYETTDTRKAYLIEESNEPDDTKSSNSSKDISEIGQKVESKISKEPPSAEDLESRFEALQRQSSPNNARADDLNKARDHVNAPTIDKNEATNPTAKVKPEATRNQSPETSDIKSKEISPTEAKLKADTANVAAIPDAPPMPKAHFADMSPSIGSLVANDQRRALIEEFQSKIKVQPNDENLKPSDINPQRKPPPPHAAVATGQRSSTKVDGTSETHANSAFFRSENYEPWHSQTNKMVRRFSDLPSRADLENRLLFLERQLIRKFYKQRCASDSEVASRQHFVDIPKKPADDELPSTSGNQRAAEELEKRVLALEKQLSENSLKLLEAVRLKAEESNEENASPRRLSTETIDANGKELVRYTHVGELEEFGSHKPINISINIKMMLNKDGEDKAKKTEAASLPTTAELEKRLEVIEQQLSSSKSEKPVSADQQTVQSAPNEEVEGGNVNRESQPIVMEKVVKDVMNEEFKNDKKDIKQLELHSKKDEKVLKDFQTENLKAEKTLENQQIARSGQAQNSKEDSDFSRVVSKNDTEVARQLEQAEKLSMKVNAEKQNEETVEHKTASDRKTFEENQSLKQNTEGPHEVSISKPREQPTASDKDSTVDKGPLHVTANASAENVNELETAKRSESLAERASELKDENKESQLAKTPTKATEQAVPNDQATITTSAIEVGPVDPKNKTLVLLLDNEPKAVKVRRLTRANTEELEGLFQALEKQLSDRNLIKSEGGKLLRASDMPQTANENPSEESKELSKLSKEIEDFAKADKEVEKAKPKPEEEYDWGPDPIKRHLKRKTVHLPSTKELEARFRSLERQIKLLEDVEKIDVEQRLGEIERKIKLQYSLSHEKELSKFLELCEGKGLDEMPDAIAAYKDKNPQLFEAARDPPATTPTKSQKPRSPYTSPSRTKEKTPYTSPTHASTSRSPKRHMSPARQAADEGRIPSTEDLEYRYRALDLTRSKSKESLNAKSKKDTKQPIHPLEMLLDASPDSSDIPTTGELEHRMRVLDEKRKTPSPPRRARSRSPTIDDLKRQKLAENQRLRTPIHSLETLVASPTKKELPTAEELEARMRALEEEQCFDFKTQKTYKEFNQKLKDVVSPSLSFDEFKPSKSREESPRRVDPPRSTTPKSALREPADGGYYRSTSPKSIRFRDDEEEYRPKSRSEIARSDTERMVGKTDGALQIIEENSKMLHRILKKTLADSSSSISGALAMAAAEGLDAMGSRLMRETSPLQRTGSHTGVPLRTNDNINERLDSIKNTIKSIDSLCEEKPYHKEKCQRYIDSLFSDSIHFASKKTSLEDLTRSDNRGRRDYTPSIRVSDHSQRPLEYYLSRSMGSADSICSTSPLRAASPLHHRSNRDLRREISPRRRRDEEREEYESRVRRENMLPNYFFDNPSALSSGSITKFHKVDRQLDTDKCDERERSNSRSASRSPSKSPYGSTEMAMLHTNSTANTSNNTATTTATTLTPLITTTMRNNNILDLDRPLSTYRHTSDNLLGYDPLRRSNTTAYAPGKLEIRHTTVTSTFYDRLLAEKEIEKKFSRLPSRSPAISPSATSNSYMDIPGASATNSTKTYNALSPTAIPPPPTTTTTTTTARADSIIGTTGYGIESRFSFGTSVTGSYQLGRSSAYSTVTSASQPNITTTTTTTNSFNSILTTTTTQNSATTPTGNFCAHQNALLSRLPMPTSVTDASNLDLRIRSCDNILMQIKSTSTTVAGLGSVAMTTTTTTTPPPPPASLTDTPSTLVQNHAITTIAATSAAPMPAANTSNNSNGFTGLNRSTAFTMLNTTSNTSYNFNLTTVGDCTASTATNTAPPPYYTPLTARQPNSDGTPYSFGLYTSTLNNNNNNNNNTAGVAHANAAAELPKL